MTSSKAFDLLIVDDEPNIRSGLAKGLESEADLIETAGMADEAMAAFERNEFASVIVDIRKNSSLTGFDLLKNFSAVRPQTTVIVVTAHGTVETAVEAMRAGAFDFILKPLDLNLVRQQVRKARRHFDLMIENQDLRPRLADSGQLSSIVAGGSAMEQVF
jgi:two-component system NtrC family response regulator